MGENAPLVMCGMVLLMFVYGFFVAGAYVVGLVNYARDGISGDLFNLSKNFQTVLSNKGLTVRLYIFVIFMGILYGIFGGIAGFLLSPLSFGDMNYLSSNSASATRFNPDFNLNLYLAKTAIYYIVVGVLSFFGQFSNAHLYASFGQELGLDAAKSKTKNDDYRF